MADSESSGLLTAMDLLDPVTTRRLPVAAVASATGSGRPTTWALDRRATGELRDALEILADQMHDAVSRRRMSPPGTESFRRADERVAYLIELFNRLQRDMAIPDEVWRLGLRLAV